MKRTKLLGAAILIVVALLMLIVTSCFGNTGITGSSTPTTPTVIKPQPRVETVMATTSGTHNAYFVTLAIKVKNDGAKGTILVMAKVTQGGKTIEEEMEVFLNQGASHELELTFPLVWEGGQFTTDVQTIVP